MNLAVLFYKDSPDRPDGMPGMWPAQVVELHNNESAPDENWVVMTHEELVQAKIDGQADYDAWVHSQMQANMPTIILSSVQKKIADARNFGINLMLEYGASNVLAGLTTAQVQYVMEKTAKLQVALSTGSLYVSIVEINAIVPDETIIKTEKITEVRNRIEDYLGIPRT